MATFVLVHAAWGGAWEWREVARGLQTRGHETFTPTLTGLGERSHLLTPDVGLDTHIHDIVNVLSFEDLRDVVLCGQSSAAMVVSGVAEAASDRLAHLVYVDSPIPEDGKSLHDLLPEEPVERFRELARTKGDGWRLPPPDSFFTEDLGMPPDVAARYVRRVVDSPLRMFEDKIRLRGEVSVPRTYIRCTAHEMTDVFAPFAQRAKDEGWGYHEIATGHDPQILAPDALTGVLDEIGRDVGR
jgi:pimeloyl-ACP methyl ester carboxylesterase